MPFVVGDVTTYKFDAFPPFLFGELEGWLPSSWGTEV
jgi:hypothetical protein